MGKSNTGDCAILTESFVNDIKHYLYIENFIDRFNDFCNGRVSRLQNDIIYDDGSVLKFGLKITIVKNVTKYQNRNKSNITIDCLAFFDVSDFVKTEIAGFSKDLKKTILQGIIELDGVVMIDGQKMKQQDLSRMIIK